jgi:hypothetical protein
VSQFQTDCKDVVEGMRQGLQEQFRKTEQYELKVRERFADFESRVLEEELVKVEKERD